VGEGRRVTTQLEQRNAVRYVEKVRTDWVRGEPAREASEPPAAAPAGASGSTPSAQEQNEKEHGSSGGASGAATPRASVRGACVRERRGRDRGKDEMCNRGAEYDPGDPGAINKASGQTETTEKRIVAGELLHAGPANDRAFTS